MVSIMNHYATCYMTYNTNKNCTFQLLVNRARPGPKGNSAANFRNQEIGPAKSFMSFNYKLN